MLLLSTKPRFCFFHLSSVLHFLVVEALGKGRRTDLQSSLRHQVYVALCPRSHCGSQEDKADLISRQNYSCHNFHVGSCLASHVRLQEKDEFTRSAAGALKSTKSIISSPILASKLQNRRKTNELWNLIYHLASLLLSIGK